MPRVSAAQRAFMLAYRSRVRVRVLRLLGAAPDGLPAKTLARRLGVSANGVDQYVRSLPEVEKSHPDGHTWYRLRVRDCGDSPAPAPVE